MLDFLGEGALLSIARILLGEIPIIGSLTVELLNVAIPNQRQERIEKLLNLMASKVFALTLTVNLPSICLILKDRKGGNIFPIKLPKPSLNGSIIIDGQ